MNNSYYLFSLIMVISIMCIKTDSKPCQVKEVKSTDGECAEYETRYVNRRREHSCVRYNYATLYHYLICKEAKLERGAQLTISDRTTNNFKYITFEDSSLPVVPVGEFTSFANVKQLYLNHSEIQTIEPAAFSGMTSLEELHLEENNITEITKGTINYLATLKSLDLSKNNISKIEDSALHGLLALKKLKLNHNLLDLVTPLTFGSLNSLEFLDLSDNRLTNIQQGSFINTHNLNALLLNNNLLKNDVLLTFENLTALRVLNASFNEIVEVDFKHLSTPLTKLNYSNNEICVVQNWDKLKNVETVDLRQNNISEINSVGEKIIYLYLGLNNLKTLGSSLFKQSNTLNKLDLGHNSIESIMPLSFQGLSKLEDLWLNKNQLIHLPIGCFKDLKSLRHLYLSHNSLTNLEFGTFAGLSKLDELWIDHNSLTSVHENSFYIFGELTSLHLNNNQINSIEVHGLLSNLKNLNYVCLPNNNWACNSLLGTIQAFKNKKVRLCEGQAFDVPNVDGIPCTNEKVVKSQNSTNLISDTVVEATTAMTFDFKTSNRTTLEASSDEKFYNSSFYKYFDRDFRNSSFYRFLNSSFQEEFKTYLESGVNNSQLVKYFDASFENSLFYNFFSKEFSNNLHEDFRNSKLFKYFDQDFLNSSFFKYFNEDFRKSGFYKELTKQKVLDSGFVVLNQSCTQAVGLVDSEGSEKHIDAIAGRFTILVSLILMLLFFMNIMFLVVLYCRRTKKSHFSKSEDISIGEANLELL